MEMQEIPGKEDRIVELEESQRVLETSVEEMGSAVFSHQERALKNTSPGHLQATAQPGIVEEPESSIFSKLNPSKASAGWSSTTNVTVPLLDLTVWNKVGRYRALCVVLSLICLVLLVVTTALGVKLQSHSPVCQETEKWMEAKEEGVNVYGERSDGKEVRPQSCQECDMQKCQALYPEHLSCVSDSDTCEKGWLYFESSCYFLSGTRMTWTDSRGDCQKRGGDLVVISDPRVQTFLTEKGNLVYWIGLRQRAGTWLWVNNTTLGHSYWSEASMHYDCGSLTGRDPPEGSWNCAPCHISTFYICERGR